MTSERSRLSAAALAGLLLAAGCADLERGAAPPLPDAAPDVGPSDGGGAGFATVRPLLESRCAPCHSPGQQAGQTAFLLGGDEAADYAAARAQVDPSNPGGSRLVLKAAGQGHGGGIVLPAGSPEQAILLAWIASGAGP